MKTLIAILLVSFALSCSSEGDPAAPSPPAGSLSATEAAALNNLDRSLVTCQGDGDCPRGAHCALHACSYECTTDTDCMHGRSCDAQGRCR